MTLLRQLALITLISSAPLVAQTVLKPETYHHYINQFAADEHEATGKEAADEWPWLQSSIPLFDSSDKRFEEMYYFRWYAWQKHVVSTKRGFVITEWLPKPDAPDGFFGALPDAAMFHLAEARWLRNARLPTTMRGSGSLPTARRASIPTPSPIPSATSRSPLATPNSRPTFYPRSSPTTTHGKSRTST